MGEALTPDEAMRLLEAVGHGPANVRDRAYLVMLFRCGLRNNEARMLDLRDLIRDREAWSARVRFPKGVESGRGKPRELGIDARTREYLEQWLVIRGSAAGPLFLTRNGRRLDTSHLRRKVKVLAKAAAIKRPVHVHALRHCFARQMHDEGVSLRLIQLALGHASLNTTAIYLSSLGDPEVIAATSEREW